jgi:NodT family efflux transporter outer membrane factor (OMF) lipoprotein
MALDPKAEAFVQRALERSPDLAQVEARWREAAALARAAEGAQQPRVDASAQASAGVDRAKSTGDSATSRQRVNTQQVGLDFRWELDLFGRLSSARQAADHERRAAKADLDAARVTLANLLRSEVVRLRSADRALTVAETLLGDLRETVAIESSARAAGLRSDVDLGQLRSNIAAREAELTTLRIELGAVRLRLRTLSDLPLRDVDALLGESVRCVVDAPIEQVPLRWLRERRDVAAAEARLQAGAAQAQSAHAALYPSIGLTGTLGRQREASTQFATIVSQSLQRSLALGLVGTLFDGGQRSAEARAADARTAAAMAAFQRTLLQAAEEVDGAIDRLQVIGVAREASEAAASESRLALGSTERRLAAGIDSRLALLQVRREAGERQLLALGFERDHCIAGLDLNRALALREAP